MSNDKNKPYILYHAECMDGFGAAYAAWKKFGARAIYHAVPPNNKLLPKKAWGRDVYVLDCAFPAVEIPKILKHVQSLTIIDHHVSNEKAAALATESLFALHHSGAVLAWNYFHPGKPIPKLLAHIEDGDVWLFKLPYTRELCRAVKLRPTEFRVWDKIARDVEHKNKLRVYIQEGALLLAFMRKSVGELIEHAETIRFAGKKCLMVNSPVYASEIGNALLQRGSPIGIIWSRRGKEVVVSLRSSGKINVARIAQEYGGGGHKAAAGFSFMVRDFLQFKKKS